MKRELMIREAEKALEDSGYKVSLAGGCFDVLAKKQLSLALKVLVNIDSFTHSEAYDLRTLASFLDTIPLLIGEHANRYHLEDSVVYARFGVVAMSPDTFTGFLDGVMPAIKSRRGGFGVNLNGEKLKDCMNSLDMSSVELSSVAGLSKKTICKCRHGDMVDMETCKSIEKAIGTDVNSPVSIEMDYDVKGDGPRSHLKRVLYMQLERLGFSFSFITRSPFNLVMKERDVIISTVDENKKGLARHADLLEEFERDFNFNPLFITAYGNVKNIEGIPVLVMNEIENMRNQKEFIESVEERQN